MKNVLADVQYPVMIVPYKYALINKILLLYDGEPSSVHAVKMFSYILPALKHLETEVLSVKNEKQSLHVRDNKLMKEFMKSHFPEAKYTVLKGNLEEEIDAYLKTQNEDVLVVLRTYEKGRVSRWFKKAWQIIC